MGAPLSAPIPTALSGEKVEISIELTAPSADGTYTGYFTLNDVNGKDVPIGVEKTFWVKIVVGSASSSSTTTGSVSVVNTLSANNSACAYSPNEGYVQELISRINEARRNTKLNPLTVNAQLSAAAQSHSADMACNNFHDHTGSDGSWIGDRILRAGYAASHYLEIIAIGSPQNAMDQWAASSEHWEAIVDPLSAEIGVGYAYYANSDFGGYITVDFGSR
jgi:uncharacterized protein YkwD